MDVIIQCLRIAAVVLLLCISSAVATPPGRLPLVLRGLRKVVRKDAGLSCTDEKQSVSVYRKLLSVALIVIAVAIALYR